MVLRTHSRSSGNISSNLSAEKMPSLKRLRVFGWKPLDGKTAEGGLLFLINRPASCLWDCPNPRSLWFHSEWVWNLRHCRFIGSLFACLSSFLQWNCKWSDKLMNRLSLRGSGTSRPVGTWTLCSAVGEFPTWMIIMIICLFFDMIIPTWMCVPWIASG